MTIPTATSIPSANAKHEFKYFDLIMSLFVAVYLISQIASTKLVMLGPFIFPGALLIFPLSYIFGDILTEVYGYTRTRNAIWIGFLAAAFMSLTLYLVQLLPPAPDWPNQGAYEAILGLVPRIVVGSLLGYWAGEFVNSYVLARMKILTQGKHLWTRTIGSTIVGQAIDSVIFATIAFYGVVPFLAVIKLIGSVYLLKVAYEALATPLTYLVVAHIKKIESVDVYDHDTNFSPFAL